MKRRFGVEKGVVELFQRIGKWFKYGLILGMLFSFGILQVTSCRQAHAGGVSQSETKSIKFTVHIPANTPSTDNIYLLLLPFYDWEELDRIPMVSNGDGTWSVTKELQEGALIRYCYDRGWDNWADFKAKRERFSKDIKIFYRHLYVSAATYSVEDTVAMWNDIQASPPTGTIKGVVKDKITGAPVMDATVSIAGVHLATNYDGSFELEGVPVGKQRVTILTTSGEYKYASSVVQVLEGEESEVEFYLEPALKVNVTFNVSVPEDTPPYSVVKLVGNLFQLGSYHGPYPNYGFTPWSSVRFVQMKKVSSNKFTFTSELYEGTYVQYHYTLGGQYYGSEKDSSGGRIFRSFIVNGVDNTRNDTVAMWKTPGQVAFTLNVTVPPNTPQTDNIFINPGGPDMAMDRVDKNHWTLTLFTYPGDTFRYKYFHGTGLGAEKFEPDNTDTLRSISIPDHDTVVYDTVEQWRWSPKATKPSVGFPVNVTFRVTVPPNTPQSDTVYIVGDTSELGSDSEANTISMVQSSTDPCLWEKEVTFNSAKLIHYHYTRGEAGKAENQTRTLDIAYDGQVVNDAVFSWKDMPFSIPRDFIKGIYPVDYWNPQFLDLYKSTLKRIKDHNGQWVVVTSVWSYGQIDPYPVVETRPVKADCPITPKEDLIKTIEMVHSMGMNAFIVPQFNMEMTPNGSDLWGTHSNAWWDRWFEEAEKLYMYHAEIAQKCNAEMLLLPGPGYHVFPQESQFADASYVSTFDQKMQALIGKLRQRYSGLLMVNGSSLLYNFPRLADYIGITSFDWGSALSVSSNASVQELKTAFEDKLDSKVKPMFVKYRKPVIIYQFAYSSVDGAANGDGGVSAFSSDDSSKALDLTEQANIYEAFFQAIMGRSWVRGLFPFGYEYIDLPEDKDYSIRAKPAEAVLSKYYRAYMVGDISGNADVGLEDAILALQIASGITPTQSVDLSADINGDSKIGIAEAIYILQEVSELR